MIDLTSGEFVVGLLLGAAIALGIVAWLEHRADIKRKARARYRIDVPLPERVPSPPLYLKGVQPPRPWPRGSNPPPTFAKPEPPTNPPAPPLTARSSGKGHSESVGVGRTP